MAQIGTFVACSLFLAFCYSSLADNLLPDDGNPLPLFKERRPRFVKIYSKGPDPEAELQRDSGFTSHLKNLLKGGTVGFEFRAPPGFYKALEMFKRKFKKFPSEEFQRKEDAGEKENEWDDYEEKMGRNVEEEEIIDATLINPRFRP